MAGMRLYVGNLPFSMTEDDLTQTFGEFGTVQSATVITDRETGRPRGFAFVEMSGEDAGQAAIDNLDGKSFDGRAIQVNVARAREERGRGGGGGGGGRDRW